jgi:hypothetical protein
VRYVPIDTRVASGPIVITATVPTGEKTTTTVSDTLMVTRLKSTATASPSIAP